MAESRQREDEREHEDNELEDALEDEAEELEEVSGGDAESLTISERRARRKARRKQKDAVEVDEVDDVVPVSTAKEAKTRSQKEALRDRERQGHIIGESLPVVGSMISYFRGVIAEMQKVTWPSREETRRLTIIVLAVTVLFSIVLGSIDIFYTWWFKRGVGDTAFFIAVGIPVLIVGGGLSWFYILREED